MFAVYYAESHDDESVRIYAEAGEVMDYLLERSIDALVVTDRGACRASERPSGRA